jgi:cytochrome P450
MATEARSEFVGAAPAWVEITDYSEVVELFRSSKVSSGLQSEADAHFRADTVIKLDRPDHLDRRRVMNSLLKRDGHEWFRKQHLFPAAERNIGELVATADAAGVAEFDLVAFSERANTQLAAGIIGIDGVSDAAAADHLLELNNVMSVAAMQTKQDTKYKRVDDYLEPGLRAKEEFVETYYKPSLAARQSLVEEAVAGKRSEGELPHDLLSLIASHADPAWTPESAIREAILVLRGAIGTSTQSMVCAVDDLFAWFTVHPQDVRLKTDPAFLIAAINESIRTHPIVPGHLRVAIDDISLATGRQIARGTHLLLATGAANHDPAVFGADPTKFNPYRKIPAGIEHYGVAFGSGPHLCLGLPIVQGSEGVDGSLVHILKGLFAAGLEPDPSREPRRTPAGTAQGSLPLDWFDFYPALIRSSVLS